MANEKHYVPIKPCKNDHWLRFKSTGACIECARAKSREWRANNMERVRQNDRARQLRDREKRLAKARDYKRRTLSERVAYNKEWRRKNKKKAAAHSKRWRENNVGLMRARVRKRQAALIRRTPKWANLEEIKKIYILAKWGEECLGETLHVDHIVPLQGKNVSGLHVAENLRIIPAGENVRKGNSWSQ